MIIRENYLRNQKVELTQLRNAYIIYMHALREFVNWLKLRENFLVGGGV